MYSNRRQKTLYPISQSVSESMAKTWPTSVHVRAKQGHEPKRELTYLDAIAKLLEHYSRVIVKVINNLGIRPAAQLLDTLRQLPVVDRDHWRDVVTQQFIDEVAVVAYARFIDVVRKPGGQKSRPGQRETIHTDPQLFHHLHVAPPLITIRVGIIDYVFLLLLCLIE